ncbi:MAG: TIGR03751 family conjugal transfer lipoprotein [Gilliamella apicola]|nr:TIGR03751 family conjugal transfer lipoprotein [Gilliamella apicola]
MKKIINLITVLCIFPWLITGCNTSKEKIFPHSNVTMNDIYNQKTSGGKIEPFEIVRNDEDIYQTIEMIKHTRTPKVEIENLFQRLPNPDLVMYVFPHLTSDGKLPIPGYSTVFPFYEEVQYAMPGELVRER